MRAAAAFLILAAVLAATPAPAQNIDLVGRWAASQGQCEAEFILFERDGNFRSTLDEEPRDGTWKIARDRVTLTASDEPDRPSVMHILDYTGSRMVAFDEAIESDRRLQRCR